MSQSEGLGSIYKTLYGRIKRSLANLHSREDKMKSGNKVKNLETGEIGTILEVKGYDVKEDVEYYLIRTKSGKEITIEMPIGRPGLWEEIT
jgi:hypothetical protein